MTIYLGTIVVSFIGNMLVFLKVAKDVENEGYKVKKEEKKNIFNSILGWIKYFFLLAIPVGNLILAGVMIVKANELSNNYIKDGIKDGTLVRKDENKVIEEVELDNNLVEDAKVVVYKVEDKEKKEMTKEEKLEFLREEYKRLTGEEVSDNYKGKQRGIGKRRL